MSPPKPRGRHDAGMKWFFNWLASLRNELIADQQRELTSLRNQLASLRKSRDEWRRECQHASGRLADSQKAHQTAAAKLAASEGELAAASESLNAFSTDLGAANAKLEEFGAINEALSCVLHDVLAAVGMTGEEIGSLPFNQAAAVATDQIDLLLHEERRLTEEARRERDDARKAIVELEKTLEEVRHEVVLAERKAEAAEAGAELLAKIHETDVARWEAVQAAHVRRKAEHENAVSRAMTIPEDDA